MTAASGTDAGTKRPSWFAQRWTIVADGEPPAGPPVRRAWWPLFLPRWLGAISEPAAGPPRKFILVDKLDGASKWAAAGFSSVTALLLFFGVKEGVLDQAIRLDPFATLCVFMLLGVGVLCALFASAINPVKRIHLWALLAAIAVMLVITAVFLPNLDFFEGTEGDVQNALSKVALATAPVSSRGIIFWGWIVILAVAALALKVIFWGSILLVVLAFLALPVFFVRWRYESPRSRWDEVFLLVSSVILLVAACYAIVSADRPTRLSVATGALLLGVTAWSFAHKSSLPAVAGIIILGVAATSLGLYGAAKVSVGTKIVAVKPQVSASLEREGEQTFLKIIAVASRMRDAQLLISVAGTPRIQEIQAHDRTVADLHDGMGAGLGDGMGTGPGGIWRSVLQPNSLEEINTTLTIPLTPARWKLVTVSHCQVDEQPTSEGERACTTQAASQDLQMGNLNPDAGAEITGHIVATSSKSLKVTLTGRNVTWGSRIQAEICRAHNGGHARQLAYATLAPDVTGAVTWNVSVPAGGNGDELILQYRQCPDKCPDPDPFPKKLVNMTQLAKYVLP